MITNLIPKCRVIIFSFTILFILGIASHSIALDVTAKTCSQTNVQSAATQVQNAGGGTVYIPAGNCTWSSQVSLSGPVSFIGQGYDKTIIRRSAGTTFNHTNAAGWVRYSGIGFYGEQYSGTSVAIYLSNAKNFRIDHCKFYASRWHGVITFKAVKKGLVDRNYFYRIPDGTSNYGIQLGSNYQSKPDETCGYTEPCNTQACINCRTTWDNWWDNPSTNNGMTFPENFTPGNGEAIYIEDNYYEWYGPAVEGNWGSRQAVVFRKNTFKTKRNGSSSWAIKPGGHYFEVYDNTFECIASDCVSNPSGVGAYLRTSGLFYNNTLINYNKGGEFAAYYCSFGYCYTPQVLMDETYIYNNTYVNVKCKGENSDCWTEWNEGAPERISENKNYFFRAPQSGDRIYPYTPFTYPHPLTLGDPVPDLPPEKPNKPQFVNP